jgi:sialic acid synthase SpsE
VSDHSEESVLVPCLALACGGLAVEKHFCMAHTEGGLDDVFALEPREFRRMVEALKKTARVLGDGVKRLAPSEAANYGRTNRSIHAVSEIKAGETFTKENTACLRTEKVLRPGLQPRYLSAVLGRKAAQDIPSGEGIRPEDVD